MKNDLIQAQPGWSVVCRSLDMTGKLILDYEPIICWFPQIYPGAELPDVKLWPVTIRGLHDSSETVVQRPDGTYRGFDADRLNNEDDILAYFAERIEEARKDRRKNEGKK